MARAAPEIQGQVPIADRAGKGSQAIPFIAREDAGKAIVAIKDAVVFGGDDLGQAQQVRAQRSGPICGTVPAAPRCQARGTRQRPWGA